MGCDIHFFVERFTTDQEPLSPTNPIDKIRDEKIDIVFDVKEKIEPRWITADKWKQVDYGSGEIYWTADELYDDRNYWLFYFLAGVRGGPIEPLDYDRGIPDDASTAYLYMTESMGSDGHSYNYFTLTELLQVDDEIWDKLEAPNFRKTLDKMKELDTNTDNVRACFFFDN